MRNPMNVSKSRRDVEANPELLKITMQYRERQGMVYEMKSQEGALDIHVWATTPTADGVRIEAHNGRLADAVVVARTGNSRRDVLREVGQAWNSSHKDLGVPAFDWDAVAALLVSVRAI
jgi:hypothetical protein